MDLNLIPKMDLEIAGCLRRLFRNRYLLRSKNTVWFQRIIEHRLKIQNNLNTFFLQLIVDESLGVIYIKEASEEIEESLAYRMGRKKSLTSFASLLLLQLRHERLQFYLNPEENVIPLIRQEQLREYLKAFDSQDIDARFEKAFQKAIKELRELQVLEETQQNSEVYEITAVCDLLLPLDEIQAYQTKINNYFNQGSKLKESDGVLL